MSNKQELDSDVLIGKVIYLMSDITEIMANEKFTLEERKYIHMLYRNYIVYSALTDTLPSNESYVVTNKVLPNKPFYISKDIDVIKKWKDE
jgi:hypothetical protein